MGFRLFLVCAAFAASLSWPGQTVLAQSLSDMNLKAFEGLSKEEGAIAPKSPFATGISTAEDLTIEDLMLTGIVTNQGRAYALVSGYLVQEGDRIAGFRVDNIEKGRVVLRRLDEVYVLTMGGM